MDRSRLRLAVGGTVLLLLLLGVTAGSQGTDSSAPPADRSAPGGQPQWFVDVDQNSSEQLWPYTSRRTAAESATLPINAVVLRDASSVRHLLTSSERATWNVTDTSDNNTSDTESRVVLNGTSIEWASAQGSTRYTYIQNTETGEGEWVEETYQLHDGTYLGSRYHLRLYEGGSGDDRWTAIQAHREHWDWFRLRHTVDTVDRAQHYVEREFFGRWFLQSVDRKRYGNGGALDSDGWVSVIRLTHPNLTPNPNSLAVVIILMTLRTKPGQGRVRSFEELRARLEDGPVNPRMLPLVASLVLLPLVIRIAGVTLETTLPTLSPKVIAAVLYPILVVGLPASTYVFSRPLRAQTAGIVAPASFGVGILLDYLYLRIGVLQVTVVAHRALLVAALGLLAVGASRTVDDDTTRNSLVLGGVLVWTVGLVIPLANLI